MFASKVYQFFLFLCLCAVLGWLYFDGNRQLASISQHQQSKFDSIITQHSNWTDKGEDLFKIINNQVPLQFFQFIDKENPDRNYTFGSFLQHHQHLLSPLFKPELASIKKIGNARLQIKLDVQAQRAKVLAKIFIYGQYTLLGYLVLAFVALSSININKRIIAQIAELIAKHSEQRASAFNNSYGLPINYRPIEDALNESRDKIKSKLESILEENNRLKKEAFCDPLTELNNTLKFTETLNDISKQEVNGVLLLLKASELAHINQTKGRLAGDKYLKKIAQTLSKYTSKFNSASVFRISSAEFAALIPHAKFEDSESFLKAIKDEFELYQQSIKVPSIAHFALIPYKNDSNPVNLLSLADTALNVAQTMGPNSYYMQEKADLIQHVGESRWKVTIENIIKKQSLVFYQQPIRSCRASQDFYQELLTRFKNSEGKVLPAAAVVAMAERYDLINLLDKLIIAKAIKMLRDTPQMTGSVGINISTSSALNPSFQAWLKSFLKNHRQLATKVVLEVNETGIQANTTASANFVRLAHSLGLRVSIEHFGMGLSAFRFFKEVRPDFIKLDGSFTKQIETNEDNKFFVKMMVDLAKRINVAVIATNIESQTEKMELEQLLVDGLQGFYIASPKPAKAA